MTAGSAADQLLRALPPLLRAEVVQFLFRRTLKKIPWLRGKPAEFVAQLSRHFTRHRVRAGEVLLKEGRHATELCVPRWPRAP